MAISIVHPVRHPSALRSLRVAWCAALLISVSTGKLQNVIANGDTRTLTFRHTHTGESLTVTFKRDGQYDKASLDELNWFLRDWRRDEPTKMDPHLFDLLWEAHRELGAKAPITIISGFRSPQTNAMLRARGRGVARFSQHMVGKAIDFYIPDADLAELRAVGLRLQRGGVGFYPSSGSPFIHVDTGGVRHWPRITREQLAKIFPDGKTVHIPSDGKPMPGFALAMAEIEARGGKPGTIAFASLGGTGGSNPDRPVAEPGRFKRVLASLFNRQGEEADEEDEAMRPGRPLSAATALSSEPGPVDSGKPVAAPTQTTVVAALEPKPAPSETRLRWVTGPAGVPADRFASSMPVPPPRPADTGDVTASLPPAITGSPRKPAETRLAYAAATAGTGPQLGPPPAAARSTRPVRPAAPLPYADASQAPASLLGKPRIAFAVEMHHPDLASVRGLVDPVRVALKLRFESDSIEAPATVRFAGSAVVALPTLAFDRGAGIVTGALSTRTN